MCWWFNVKLKPLKFLYCGSFLLTWSYIPLLSDTILFQILTLMIHNTINITNIYWWSNHTTEYLLKSICICKYGIKIENCINILKSICLSHIILKFYSCSFLNVYLPFPMSLVTSCLRLEIFVIRYSSTQSTNTDLGNHILSEQTGPPNNSSIWTKRNQM